MTWMLTWIQAVGNIREGDENPDFILNTSQIGTSASVRVNVHAKVKYYKKYQDQVIIEKEKENAHIDGHQENSIHVAGLEPDMPDTSTPPESEWRHNTLLIP